MANDRTGLGRQQETRRVRLRRDSDEVKAARAQGVLADPEWTAAFDRVRGQLISDIEATPLDGSDDKSAAALELVRKLQALISIKREIMRPITVLRLGSTNNA